MRMCPNCEREPAAKRRRYCSDECRDEAAKELVETGGVKRDCAYCGREHRRRGTDYCSGWCARKGAAHSAAASRQRGSALKAAREGAAQRSFAQTTWRQMTFHGLDPLDALRRVKARRAKAKR